ncbi:MAG: ATP phosphoribosyltransferase regulatory subunit [Campylobacteraceae bacterium]|jgi:histidyl-tRNA synthetase|nr:ATP phosphoribosyltransferase regulatory subunit [Campylobacteraceae bacterium]
MIYEHEIPQGSKLYFAKSARLKREIEAVASDILYKENFEEIITPFFSYHQHQSVDEKMLIRFSDTSNHIISLRADSTLDVVRIITRRLGRATKQKKWFYIQPVFHYPSTEINQIGAEFIGGSDLNLCVNAVSGIFKHFDISPLLYVSNVKIPKIISKMLNIPLEVFANSHIEDILNTNESWLINLATMQKPEEIEKAIDISPKPIRDELLKLKSLVDKISYKNMVIAPLFYSKMRYYDALFFSFIYKNEILGSGGAYHFEGLESVGFGLYTDAIVETIIKINEER